ncbi:NAD(P)H-dependent oxidoreductase, partial [Candidatus Dojkabacteria bacterium]|nr:NAD(P)H-dependent oxidoreductase [Candidatus Dojkabacteria bacterium]
RSKSYNTVLLKEAKLLAPKEMVLEIFDINRIPMFNQDLEGDNLPDVIKKLRTKVSDSSGMLVATPEYGNMVPGVLKNMFEWLSRNYDNDLSPVINKPLAIIGASDGGFGTVRAQNQLLLMGAILRMRVDATLRLPISKADTLINDEGVLQDKDTEQKLRKLLDDFYMSLI